MRTRIFAFLVLSAVCGIFGIFRLAAVGRINLNRWLDPCGVKQQYGLPCPCCGMTSSAIAFVQGRILESFCLQPAAALFCCGLVLTAVMSFVSLVCGTDFGLASRIKRWNIKHILLVLAAIVLVGWSVTFLRALAERF